MADSCESFSLMSMTIHHYSKICFIKKRGDPIVVASTILYIGRLAKFPISESGLDNRIVY